MHRRFATSKELVVQIDVGWGQRVRVIEGRGSDNEHTYTNVWVCRAAGATGTHNILRYGGCLATQGGGKDRAILMDNEGYIVVVRHPCEWVCVASGAVRSRRAIAKRALNPAGDDPGHERGLPAAHLPQTTANTVSTCHGTRAKSVSPMQPSPKLFVKHWEILLKNGRMIWRKMEISNLKI